VCVQECGMCVCIVRQSWADGGAGAELHGRAAALAVSNVGDDPAAAPLCPLLIRRRPSYTAQTTTE
jgi:hypothetical protein